MRGILTLSVLATLVSILAFCGYMIGSREVPSGKDVTLIVTTIGHTSTEHFGATGFTALELLESTHDVTMMSDYIKCIDLVCGGQEYHWTYYVNGKRAPKSASVYQVKKGEIIEKLPEGDLVPRLLKEIALMVDEEIL